MKINVKNQKSLFKTLFYNLAHEELLPKTLVNQQIEEITRLTITWFVVPRTTKKY